MEGHRPALGPERRRDLDNDLWIPLPPGALQQGRRARLALGWVSPPDPPAFGWRGCWRCLEHHLRRPDNGIAEQLARPRPGLRRVGPLGAPPFGRGGNRWGKELWWPGRYLAEQGNRSLGWPIEGRRTVDGKLV